MVPKDWYCSGQHSVLEILLCGCDVWGCTHDTAFMWWRVDNSLESVFSFLFMGTGVWTQVTGLLWQLLFSVKPSPCLAKTALSLNAPALFLGREVLLIWLCFDNLVHVSYLTGPFAITFFLFSQQNVLWYGFSLRLASSALLSANLLCCSDWLCLLPHSFAFTCAGWFFPFPEPFFLQVPLFFQSFLPTYITCHLPVNTFHLY